MKLIPLILIFISVLFPIYCIHLKSEKVNPETSVILFDGDTIQLGEFLLVAKQIKSDVYMSFRKQISNTEAFEEEEFWISNFNGSIPIEKLKLETEKRLIRIKTEQALAEKFKIIKKFDYSDFIVTLEDENKRRLEAYKNKKPLYGPVRYSEDFYYAYLYRNMIIKLKDTLANEVFTLNDIKYRNFFKDHKDSLFRNSNNMSSLLAETRVSSGYKKLDEVKGQIRQILLDREYEKLIERYLSTKQLAETDESANLNTNDYILYAIINK